MLVWCLLPESLQQLDDPAIGREGLRSVKCYDNMIACAPGRRSGFLGTMAVLTGDEQWFSALIAVNCEHSVNLGRSCQEGLVVLFSSDFFCIEVMQSQRQLRRSWNTDQNRY
jgi:hypothetical protein